MGVYTSIEFHNANDPAYVKAKNGTPEEREEWEDDNGSFEDTPGARVQLPFDIVQQTGEEYGGWIIPIADIPPGVTHIHVFRG